MLAIYIVLMLLAFVLVFLVGKLGDYEYDYKLVPGYLGERRKRALATSAFRRFIDPLVVAYAAVVPKLGLQGHRARIRRLLIHAGNPHGHTAEEYIGYGMAVSTLVYAGGVLLFALKGELALLVPLVPAAIAYWMRTSSLQNEVANRRVQIDRQIPFYLDLISLSMGAGASFLQACESIVGGRHHGPMEEEISLMLSEVSAGTPLPIALTNMTKRSDSDELAAMVRAVKQGEELGTPLVKVIGQQADQNRYRRTKRGEQIAAKLPNRLAVPTVFMMLAVFLLLFGPIIVRAIRGEMA